MREKSHHQLIGVLFFCCLLASSSLFSAENAVEITREADGLENFSYGKIAPELEKIGYSGTEHLFYDVFWTGGVKIGEIQMHICSLPDVADGYSIEALISTRNSVMDLVYPINDRHITLVKGEQKLPWYSEMWQEEGRDYRAHREALYDQDGSRVTVKKEGKIKGIYTIIDDVHNEFSAFMGSRLMPFTVGDSFLVATFADNRRIPVKVTPIRKEPLRTLFGEIDTFVVMPELTFRGLYDKQGDTVIWYSADQCRVPVRIESKIVIGSLTARLVGYENQACVIYPTLSPQGLEKKKFTDKEKK